MTMLLTVHNSSIHYNNAANKVHDSSILYNNSANTVICEGCHITREGDVLHVRVGILPTCEKHLHDRIISLREEVRWYEITRTPLTEMAVPSQESARFERLFNLSLERFFILLTIYEHLKIQLCLSWVWW